MACHPKKCSLNNLVIRDVITSLGSKFHIKEERIKKEYLLTLQSTCVINNLKSWSRVLITELIASDLYVK